MFQSLASDTSGNALMIMAFAIVPLFALVGSGVDMGRAYAVQSRLQQACDSGTLAARKELATTPNFSAANHGPAITQKANRFFNVNFPDKLYNTKDRSFDIAIESDSSISGVASVVVPTDVMKMFGKRDIALSAKCRAELSVPNTDIMMALDVTLSMTATNPGDSGNRLSVLKTVVKNFFTTIESAKSSTSRIRYGFVPYSTNVNVGGLLKQNWVVNRWDYPSRVLSTKPTRVTEIANEYSAVTYISGSYYRSTHSTTPATRGSVEGQWTCPSLPTGSYTERWSNTEVSRTPVTNPDGFRIVTDVRRTRTGIAYWNHLDGQTCITFAENFSNYIDSYRHTQWPVYRDYNVWIYKDINTNTGNWKAETNGCMEERSTYEITDYNNVDLSRAKDLDIDSEPTNDRDTQWRPMYPEIVYGRAKNYWGGGSFTSDEVTTTADFYNPKNAGYAACPAAAKKLQVWDKTAFDGYVDGLTATGHTYHDIGMIWAARLLSPTGIFASENSDISASKPTSRHLIFMTDGQTEPFDLNYGAYGLEPLSKRRWSETSPLTLTQTVEKRFSFACEEAKKKRITVWVIAFGTTVNPIMTQCAGPGRTFSASNAGELQTAFLTIAKSIGSLRLSE